jgi:hypothetical protein
MSQLDRIAVAEWTDRPDDRKPQKEESPRVRFWNGIGCVIFRIVLIGGYNLLILHSGDSGAAILGTWCTVILVVWWALLGFEKLVRRIGRWHGVP